MEKKKNFDEQSSEESNLTISDGDTQGQRIRKLRLIHGDKLVVLAHILKYRSPSSISKIEADINQLSADGAKRLADYWKLPLDVVLCRSIFESSAEEDRARLERRFRSSLSDEMKNFLKSLGLPLPGVGFDPRYIDRETGEKLTYMEAIQRHPVVKTAPDGWSAVTDVEPDGAKVSKTEPDQYFYSVRIGRRTHNIPADRFEAMLKIVMDSARSSFEIACRRLAESKESTV